MHTTSNYDNRQSTMSGYKLVWQLIKSLKRMGFIGLKPNLDYSGTHEMMGLIVRNSNSFPSDNLFCIYVVDAEIQFPYLLVPF